MFLCQIQYEPSLYEQLFKKVCRAIAAGNSIIVLGEAGTGKTDFAVALHKEMLGEYQEIRYGDRHKDRFSY